MKITIDTENNTIEVIDIENNIKHEAKLENFTATNRAMHERPNTTISKTERYSNVAYCKQLVLDYKVLVTTRLL